MRYFDSIFVAKIDFVENVDFVKSTFSTFPTFGYQAFISQN